MELNTMSVHALSERVEELEQQLAAANAQIARDEEHHQAAMTMSEKHRKNWVEVSQKLAAIKDELDDAREELSISEFQRARDFERANEWKAANSHLIAALSKVRALPSAWRARADKVPHLDDLVEAHQKCAEELESALAPPAAEPTPCGHVWVPYSEEARHVEFEMCAKCPEIRRAQPAPVAQSEQCDCSLFERASGHVTGCPVAQSEKEDAK